MSSFDDVVVEVPVPGREADTAPAPTRDNCDGDLPQAIHQKDLLPEAHGRPLNQLHATNWMFVA
eukprot:2607244-Ditylum_brightwellii.AAC.1